MSAQVAQHILLALAADKRTRASLEAGSALVERVSAWNARWYNDTSMCLLCFFFFLFFFLCYLQLHGPKFIPFKETREVLTKFWPKPEVEKISRQRSMPGCRSWFLSTTVIKSTLTMLARRWKNCHTAVMSFKTLILNIFLNACLQDIVSQNDIICWDTCMNYALWIGSLWILWFAMWRIQAGTCFLSIDCRLSFRHELPFALLGGRFGSWVLSGKLGHRRGVSKATSGSASWSNGQVKGITRSSLGHLDHLCPSCVYVSRVPLNWKNNLEPEWPACLDHINIRQVIVPCIPTKCLIEWNQRVLW